MKVGGKFVLEEKENIQLCDVKIVSMMISIFKFQGPVAVVPARLCLTSDRGAWCGGKLAPRQARAGQWVRAAPQIGGRAAATRQAIWDTRAGQWVGAAPQIGGRAAATRQVICGSEPLHHGGRAAATWKGQGEDDFVDDKNCGSEPLRNGGRVAATWCKQCG